jgi:ABC-2 type transport system ATP-binding protein
MDTVIEATGLTKHYEDFSLRSVGLTVRGGSVSGIFGPNAAGKSTLLRMLAGQTPVPAGTLRVLGGSYGSAEQDLKNRIGYVPQEPVFFEERTVEWHARFVAPYFARWDGACFFRLLEDFRVNPLKKVKHLSGGQKKLLSLALALSHGADLLILDEPTAGLDIVHRRSLLDRLRAQAAAGEATVVVASHITDGLDQIAEDITFLHDGRVVLQGGADDLMTRWKWILYKEGSLDRAIEERFASIRHQPFGCRGLTNDFPAIRGAITPALESGDARLDHASLEDILLSFVKGA